MDPVLVVGGGGGAAAIIAGAVDPVDGALPAASAPLDLPPKAELAAGMPTEELIVIIQAAAAAHEAAFLRIAAKPTKRSFDYYCVPMPTEGAESMRSVVEEVTIVEAAADVLATWRPSLAAGSTTLIQPIENFFNDSLDLTVNGFADLQRVSRTMLPVARKYAAFFTGSTVPMANKQLALFVAAFDAISAALQSAWLLLQDAPSQLAVLRAQAAALDAGFARMGAAGVQFAAPPPPSSEHLLRDIGATEEHLIMLCEWLVAADGTGSQTAPFAFTLLYQASRDGFSAADFHRCCDGRGSTLTLMKERDEGFLFGGFCRRTWGGPSAWKADQVAFVFTLTNPHGEPPTMLSVSGAGENAIYASPTSGPVFGSALRIVSMANTTVGSSSSFTADSTYPDVTQIGDTLFTGAATGWTLSEILVFGDIF